MKLPEIIDRFIDQEPCRAMVIEEALDRLNLTEKEKDILADALAAFIAYVMIDDLFPKDILTSANNFIKDPYTLRNKLDIMKEQNNVD